MHKDMIKPIEISIKDKKHMVKGHVIRCAVFARTHVMEVLSAENERFFLIYYKHSLLFGGKLDKIKEGSFIHRVFQKGIVVESNLPIISTFIPNPSISIPNKNKLLSQLENHFSLLEIAYVATTLDSFFEKDELIHIIEKIFFHYRRSGNFMKSFQVIHILHEFAPELKSAKDRLNSQEFTAYDDFYKSSTLSVILNKDPLYVELHCFRNRTNPELQNFLQDLYKNQNCIIELLALWLESPKAESIETYTGIALQFVTMEEWILTVGEAGINPYQVLPEAKSIIEKMVKKDLYERAALYLIHFLHDLPISYDSLLDTIWTKLNAGFVGDHLNDFIFMLEKLTPENHAKQLEQKVYELIVILLQEYDLKTVHEKLVPIQKIHSHSLVLRKLNEMLALVEDPDQMMKLGDYYAEFKQYDQAIDCFSWEMELHPQDPSPVQKISKMYQSKGMVEEAATYQNVYAQIKENEATG